MRIISKHNDYYDGAMAHGQDLTVVYSRTKQMFEPKEFKYPFEMPYYAIIGELNNKNHELRFLAIAILFCGRLYRAIQVLDVKHPQYYSNHDYHGETFYDLASLQEYIEQKGFDTSDSIRRSYKGRKRRHPFFKQEVHDFFADNKTDRYQQFCIDNQIIALAVTKRIFNKFYMTTCGEYRTIINPILKEHQFFRVFDSFTAYQEIDMWVSGVLPRTTTPMVEIEDKHKISEHGFDEWSFRKLPTKRIS